MFNAGCEGLSECMKLGRSSWRSVTAVTGSAFTASFDAILPVGRECDGVRWGIAGRTVHAKIMELI